MGNEGGRKEVREGATEEGSKGMWDDHCYIGFLSRTQDQSV